MNNKIGNITKIKWHYIHFGLGRGVHGHSRVNYAPEYKTPEHKTSEHKTPEQIYNDKDVMDVNTNYAYIYVKNEQIYVRNLFVSTHPEGFKQKNTYFPDELSGMFMLEDTNNKLLEYIQHNRPSVNDLNNSEDWHELYFCVEYEIKEGVNKGLLDYMVYINLQYNSLESRLKKVEEEILSKKTEKLKQKSWF